MSLVENPQKTVAAPVVTIVIPTYREAENLPVIVPRVAEVMEQHRLAVEILVVDDDSSDGTDRVCEQLSEQYPIRLITRRENRGLSPAVLRGLDEAEGDAVVVMDADLSHPPEKIPEMLDELNDPGVDFVIGSRYVPGGGTDEDWGLFRWLNSKVATWMARPFTTAKDPMAGFFALRRETYQQAQELNPVGYKIGLELMVKCGCRTIREVPIHFSDRLHGESKLSLKEQINYLRHLLRLGEYKLRHLPRLPKFLAVGASGSVIDLGSFAIVFTILQISLPRNLAIEISRALAIWVAMTWNFYWNRRWTFFESRNDGLVRQYVMFCLACSVGGIVNWSISIGLCRYMPFFEAYPVASGVVGIIAGTAFNYLASCLVVFKKRTDS